MSYNTFDIQGGGGGEYFIKKEKWSQKILETVGIKSLSSNGQSLNYLFVMYKM